jgi:hypothetical protein
MDIQPRSSREDTPNRIGQSGPQRPRPVMNDFAPRRPLDNTPMQRPAHAVSPTTSAPTPTPRPQPTPPRPAGPHHGQPAPHPLDTMPQPPRSSDMADAPDPPKRRSTSGHAGLVGLLLFVVLAALLLSPLLPGKVVESLPGSSSSSSTGSQTLACANDLQNTSSTKAYTTKKGSPLVYTYATETTLKGTCDGKPQSVIAGTTSQFSPVAALANVAVAAVLAIVVAIIWRKIFGTKV